MSERAKDLAERFTAFNNEVMEFVENCSDENWRKVCPGENWPIGVVARHIGAAHYRALGLAKMIAAGEKLPKLTDEAINGANAKHAQNHNACGKEEVLGILRENGSALTDFLAELTDENLDHTAVLEVVGGEISTRQFVESVILQSAGEHLANMQSATGA